MTGDLSRRQRDGDRRFDLMGSVRHELALNIKCLLKAIEQRIEAQSEGANLAILGAHIHSRAQV